MAHTTYLTKIINNTTSDILFISQEHQTYSYQLSPGAFYPDNGRWRNGAPYPWCVDSLEVTRKAFRIYLGTDTTGPILLYVYQYYLDDEIYYKTGPASSPFHSRVTGGEGRTAFADLSIEANLTASVAASWPYDYIVVGFATPPTPFTPDPPEVVADDGNKRSRK